MYGWKAFEAFFKSWLQKTKWMVPGTKHVAYPLDTIGFTRLIN